MPVRVFKLLIALVILACAPAATAQSGPVFERVYELKPEEGVFAYSRISPDGRFLAYASEIQDAENNGQIVQTVTVVDLSDRKILFEEPGIDAYWSLDGKRIIYSSYAVDDVSLWDRETGRVHRDVAPTALGDYYSWATDRGRPLIVTILGNFYNLQGDKAALPAGQVPACPGIGAGERPLVSKDGKRITTFVAGTVVVRNLEDCNDIFDTGQPGAKADFSYDGRYIAFHAPKADQVGSQIEIVDLQRKTLRVLALPGNALFPSWTRDGRLSFRYDSPEYRGFMTASNVLSAPEIPLPEAQTALADSWNAVFPETQKPKENLALVMVWGSWSAHSPLALRDLQRAAADFRRQGLDIAVLTAPEPATFRADLDRIRAENAITLPEIPLSPTHFAMTEARNQIPTTLLFKDGKLIDRRLGPQSYAALQTWIRGFPSG